METPKPCASRAFFCPKNPQRSWGVRLKATPYDKGATAVAPLSIFLMHLCRHINVMCLLASPRYSISYIMQIIKGKSSAWLKKKIKRTKGIYEDRSLWARGYFVSTIGMDEQVIRRYVKHQNHHNEVEQPSLFNYLTLPPA